MPNRCNKFIRSLFIAHSDWQCNFDKNQFLWRYVFNRTITEIKFPLFVFSSICHNPRKFRWERRTYTIMLIMRRCSNVISEIFRTHALWWTTNSAWNYKVQSIYKWNVLLAAISSRNGSYLTSNTRLPPLERVQLWLVNYGVF